MNLRKRPPLQLRPLQTMRSNKKKSCTTATIKSQLPLTLRRLEPMQRHIRNQLRGCDVDRNLSLRVLSASLTMQRDYLVMKSKKKGKKVRHPAIRSRILQMFGISPNTYSAIMKMYLRDCIIYVTGRNGQGRAGNRLEKITRVPRTNQVQVKIREWVRQRRSQRQRTTARQVVDYLVEERILVVRREDNGAYER